MITTNIEITDSSVLAKVAGRLDTAAAAQFQADIQPIIENADKQITLDCTNLEFISSSGLRLLLTLRKATLAKGGKIVITNISEDIKQVFAITGFTSLFQLA